MKAETDVVPEERAIDAVALMRKLRKDVNDQMRGKTYEEQRRYLDDQLGRRKAETTGSGTKSK